MPAVSNLLLSNPTSAVFDEENSSFMVRLLFNEFKLSHSRSKSKL